MITYLISFQGVFNAKKFAENFHTAIEAFERCRGNTLFVVIGPPRVEILLNTQLQHTCKFSHKYVMT